MDILNFFPIIIAIGVCFLIYKAIRGGFGGKKITSDGMLCTACLSQTQDTKTITRGNIVIELILWLCFLVPGLIYSIWRLSTRYKACPTCSSKELIPATSPRARQLLSNA